MARFSHFMYPVPAENHRTRSGESQKMSARAVDTSGTAATAAPPQ